MSAHHGAPIRWAGFIDALQDAVWLVDLPTLTIMAANAQAGQLAGVPASGLVGQSVTQWMASPLDEAMWAELQEAPADHTTRTSVGVESWALALDGQRHPVTTRLSVLPPGAGEGLVLASMKPRAVEYALRAELDERVGELQATLEATADGILVAGLDGRIQRFNQRFAQLWAFPKMLLRDRSDAALRTWMKQRVADPSAWARLDELIAQTAGAMPAQGLMLTLADSTTLECHARPLQSAGATMGIVLSFRDLSESLRSQRQIERLLSTDRLTGLPNRQVFVQRVAERMSQRQAQTRRLEGRTTTGESNSKGSIGRQADSCALLLVGLDRFRIINDSLGSPTGDAVLVEVARRLEASVGRADIVARLGGDEFAVCLDAVDVRSTEVVARRLQSVLHQPYEHQGTRFTLTASMGLSLIDANTVDVDSVLQEANAALRRAKEAGRATFRFHQARHNIDLRERLRIDQAMRDGLPAGDFKIVVQPQFHLTTLALVGAETLLRWRDPVLGEVAPARFIPMAEDNGFIVDLGQWVLEQAAHMGAGWRRDGHPVPISVNVSALQFRQPDFVERVMLALDRAQLPAPLLELELTESILLGDVADAQARLSELKKLGVKLALDDFGTGYSSLAYLRDLPLDRLKLDRSFVALLPHAPRQVAIVKAVIAMALELGLDVVAEGVETTAQAEFLRGCGCPTVQGYLYGRPMEPIRLQDHRNGPHSVSQIQGAVSPPPRTVAGRKSALLTLVKA